MAPLGAGVDEVGNLMLRKLADLEVLDAQAKLQEMQKQLAQYRDAQIKAKK
jgi:hypothetical protein